MATHDWFGFEPLTVSRDLLLQHFSIKECHRGRHSNRKTIKVEPTRGVKDSICPFGRHSLAYKFAISNN